MDEGTFERGYAVLAFCQAALHNVFLIYYVQVYVYYFKIDQSIFWTGQIIFLVWNSVNDPLFGYLLDRRVLLGRVSSKKSIVRSKIAKVTFYGPLLSCSFYLFWSPLFPPGVNFVIALCLYDGFLTVVDLALSSLMSDYSVDNVKRAKLSKARSVGNIAAAAVVFTSYCVWDKDNIEPFKFFCFVVAATSACGFYFGGNFLLNHLPHSAESAESVPASPRRNNSLHVALHQMWELCRMRNFALFIAMSLVQVFHCHFNSNFMPLFLEVLLQNQLPEYFCPLIMGVSFLLPHLNNFYFLELCSKIGTYSVIKILLTVKLVTAVIVYVSDYQMVWLIAIFIASNRIFTEGICKLCDLIISDLIDEDYIKHNRESTASSFVFGSAALLTKPGQTLAPLIGTVLLGATVESEAHHFFILAAVPFCCALVQLILWQSYDLKGAKLGLIKSAVNKVHLV